MIAVKREMSFLDVDNNSPLKEKVFLIAREQGEKEKQADTA